VFHYLHDQFSLPEKHGLDLSRIHSNEIFIPSVPLLERKRKKEGEKKYGMNEENGGEEGGEEEREKGGNGEEMDYKVERKAQARTRQAVNIW
jgi:hypothetical protein